MDHVSGNRDVLQLNYSGSYIFVVVSIVVDVRFLFQIDFMILFKLSLRLSFMSLSSSLYYSCSVATKLSFFNGSWWRSCTGGTATPQRIGDIQKGIRTHSHLLHTSSTTTTTGISSIWDKSAIYCNSSTYAYNGLGLSPGSVQLILVSF